MKEFNENPFAKNTPVVPFSNSVNADIWSESNCHKCLKYECKSKKESEAGCKLAFYIDLGQVEGNIPLWVAKEIGCIYTSPLYQLIELSKVCTKIDYIKSDKDSPF